MKSFVPPKREPSPPGRPLVQGYPTFYGMRVTHPTHGDGSLAWCEWRLFGGDWVPPLERDSRTGHWVGVVTQDVGGYHAPLTELRLAD